VLLLKVAKKDFCPVEAFIGLHNDTYGSMTPNIKLHMIKVCTLRYKMIIHDSMIWNKTPHDMKQNSTWYEHWDTLTWYYDTTTQYKTPCYMNIEFPVFCDVISKFLSNKLCFWFPNYGKGIKKNNPHTTSWIKVISHHKAWEIFLSCTHQPKKFFFYFIFWTIKLCNICKQTRPKF
jgi:hypothetical protein